MDLKTRKVGISSNKHVTKNDSRKMSLDDRPVDDSEEESINIENSPPYTNLPSWASMEGLDAWDRLIFGTEYERSGESIIAGDDFIKVIEV